jgi:hypothetical protein
MQADEACPLNLFIRERCRLHRDGRVGKTQLREAFNQWAGVYGYTTLSQKEFFPLLRDLTDAAVYSKGKVPGTNDDAYRGIELK